MCSKLISDVRVMFSDLIPLAQNILGPVKGQGNSLSFYMELVLAVVSSISWIKIY